MEKFKNCEFESISDEKFQKLSKSEMENLKGGWRFWGKEKWKIGYGDDAYYETHQYVLGVDVWHNNNDGSAS